MRLTHEEQAIYRATGLLEAARIVDSIGGEHRRRNERDIAEAHLSTANRLRAQAAHVRFEGKRKDVEQPQPPESIGR